MKLEYYTKIQKNGGSLRTSIPLVVRELFDINKEDMLKWTVTPRTEQIIVEKVSKDEVPETE
jgi:bifunctional DNA-binding transcriptional regulator/antitoxin component of YhaV-PrlF toxin-antitoxin module